LFGPYNETALKKIVSRVNPIEGLLIDGSVEISKDICEAADERRAPRISPSKPNEKKSREYQAKPNPIRKTFPEI